VLGTLGALLHAAGLVAGLVLRLRFTLSLPLIPPK